MTKLVAALCLLSLTLVFAQDQAIDDFTEGNHKFTAAIYETYGEKNKGNFLISPLSAEIVLALTTIGAKNLTSQELISGLQLPTTNDKIREAVRSLAAKLNIQQETPPHTLASANKVYLAENFNIDENFQAIAVKDFAAEVANVNFAKNAEAAQAINSWVENRTNDKIKNLIDPSSLGADTKVVLVNALYFYAEWSRKFDAHDTRKRQFFNDGKDPKLVDTMQIETDFKYYECSKVNARYVELPYNAPGSVSMTIVLPNEKNGLPELEKNLNRVFGGKRNYTTERLQVTLPKFKLESSIEFVPILKEFSIIKPFNSEADFSGITSSGNLFISKVIQKTFIEVAEKGTEAAAATAVEFVLLSAAEIDPKPEVKEFRVDHPFLFYLKKDDVILFTGRINKLL